MANNSARNFQMIQGAISLLEMDMSGLTVLTEVGSGSFLYTPIIAATAGAKRVIAWTKDTPYGKADDIVKECKVFCKRHGIPGKIEYRVNDQPIADITDADVITNSGHLRPLNRAKLKYVNPRTVIPLMYEKWEIRDEDIDLAYCKENGISVAGTWENYPTLKIFDFCEALIVKIALEAGYEINSNNIIVYSNDHFGELAQEAFRKLRAKSVLLTTNIEEVYDNIKDTDFIFFCDYKNPKVLIGTGGLLDIDRLKTMNPALGIVHLAGDIDNKTVSDNGLTIYPDKRGHAVRMTYTLGHLGPLPTILLQAAGLKVGELMHYKKENDLVQPIV